MQALPWSDFRDELVQSYVADRRAKKTITKLKQVFRELGEFVTATADLDVRVIQRWKLANLDREPITFNGLLGYARAIANHAVTLGYLDRSPFVGVRYRLRAKKSRKRKHLSREEIGKLLTYLESKHQETWKAGRLHALAMLLAHTGLRAMEALKLRVEDVDLERGLVDLVARDALKTAASEATIPLAPAVLPCLADWSSRCGSTWLFPGSRRNGPWIHGSNGKRPADELDEAGLAAGLPAGTNLHMLRHTAATHLRNGFELSALEVQQLLRHTTVLTQSHYCHADMAHLQGRVSRVDFRQALAL